MTITDPLVLPKDVLLVPTRDLAPSARARLDCSDDDYVVTRPRGRPGSALVDRESVDLVELFRSPCRIVDAVVQRCAATGADPDTLLTDAFPLLRTLYDKRMLVEEGSVDARPVEPILAPAGRVDRFVVEYCVQSLSDCDVYRVREGEERFALKLARSPDDGLLARLLAREHDVLTHLGGVLAPRSAGLGNHEGRPFLASEWREGVGALFACTEFRRQGAHTELLELCCAIADAYAALHEREVVHGDVHPENVLVGADGSVTLLDFGLAALAGAAPTDAVDRGGVAYFFEPEYAKAVLAKKRRPPATLLGEQYALAALLYLLITGVHYTEFSVERNVMMRQIVEDTPLPFAARSVQPSPVMEAALAKALRKSPMLRYASVGDFAAALRNGVPGDRAVAMPRTAQRTIEFRQRTLDLFTAGRVSYTSEQLRAPTSSVNYGAAGIAYAWYRLALSNDEPEYLAMADAWCIRAASTASRDARHDSDAFVNPSIGIHPAEIGTSALYHTATGIHCVEALVSHARGDAEAADAAVRRYVRAAARGDEKRDLVLGRAGVLLGCALMVDALSTTSLCDTGALVSLGSDLSRDVDAYCEDPVTHSDGDALGIAHGMAGLLYARMRWAAVADSPLPTWVGDRLDQLTALRGARDGRTAGSSPTGTEAPSGLTSSWCSGAAGHIFLWLEANRHFPSQGFAEIAERAGIATWVSSERNASLCCGLAGRGFALLALHRETQEVDWLKRACKLCDRAAETGVSTDVAYSLFKGDLGIALLSAELEQPVFARFPLFESEDWHIQ